MNPRLPKENLEKLIRENYQLFIENTFKIQFITNPTENRQLAQENEKQLSNIESHLNAYTTTCELMGLAASEDIVQIAAGQERFKDLAMRLNATRKPASPWGWGGAPKSNVSPGVGTGKCPYCGAGIRPGDNFCLNCGNRLVPPSASSSPGRATSSITYDDFLISPDTNTRQERSSDAPQDDASLLFRMNYHFVHQFMPKSEEKLAEFVVSFSSRGDVASSDDEVSKHICLLLDVSSSMDMHGKYDYLLEAIPYVFEELSDEDWLSIILFSTRSELVWSKSVANCRGKSREIQNRINQSGVRFGGTYLAPGLRIAINEIEYFNADHPKAVTRLYILTDGQLSDTENCIELNPQLQRLRIEVNSFGFGQDFDEKGLRQVMQNCPGGRVNWISSIATISRDFRHLGEVAKKIVATDAELELLFLDNVVPADAFRFRPGRYWFGPIDDRSKRSHLSIGTLEKEREYMYAFGARLFPTEEEREQIATAVLRYRFQGEQHEVKQDIFVDRSSEPRRLEQVDKDIKSLFLVLGSLKSNDNDAEALMKGFQARLEMLREEGGYEAQVQVLEKALQKLAEEGTLQGFSESEMSQLYSDDMTLLAPGQQIIPQDSDE